MLQRHTNAFSWSHNEMTGINHNNCIHHIYIQENACLIGKPQILMNLTMREIVKEIQKLLDANLIYPIPGSQWVSPLIIVPNKNGKW
jgi:hypothetical protein